MVIKNSKEFQWNNLDLFCFSPKNVPTPQGKEAREPRIANSLYLGHFPKEYGFSFAVNGIRVEKNEVNFLAKARDHSISITNEPICLVMELEKETIQFIELDEIIDAKSLKFLDDWVTKENETLLKIANEYEQFNRQFYHFMYDVIALSKAISRLNESEQRRIINETKSALILLHNRVQSEISWEYRSKGNEVILFPQKQNGSKPDLLISDVYVDVKTIIIPGRDKKKLLKNFVKRLEKILKKEQEEEQIGVFGTFFVCIWSGFLSSFFYTTFKKFQKTDIFKNVKLHETIPPLTKEKIIFVLPAPDAFHNYYLEVERRRVIRISNFVYKKAFGKISQSEWAHYLTLTNVREGCPFGLTGKNPMIIFKLT